MNLKAVKEKDSKFPWTITIANESTGETSHKRLKLPESVHEAFIECILAVAPLVGEEANEMHYVGFSVGESDNGLHIDLNYSVRKGFFAHEIKVAKIPIKIEDIPEELRLDQGKSQAGRDWLEKTDQCNFLRDRLNNLEEVIEDNWGLLSGMEAGQQMDLFASLPELMEVDFVDSDGVVHKIERQAS